MIINFQIVVLWYMGVGYGYSFTTGNFLLRVHVQNVYKPCGYLVAIQVVGDVTGVVWSSQSLLSLPRCQEQFYTDPSNLLHEQHYSLMVRYQGFGKNRCHSR